MARKRQAPFSLRLTFEQRARLEADAAGMSLAAYIHWRLFDPAQPPPRQRGKAPVKDQEAIARVIGMLGQSRIANNLNQLARQANLGTLPVTPDTEAALAEAAADIAAMRAMLVKALGLDAAP
ncbi:plasmid mobilization relaxosome protein MobC [uncultured Novosphingobium sp.]|uniref:plasmid mobilization protein n=1 Tax=uncultured Novosphingobium sp. TaxID=292277 RepID=UPI00259171AE|nr:plasmid mobilization relaxosome protein MobC [uncultured Novosphingobium sp.]